MGTSVIFERIDDTEPYDLRADASTTGRVALTGNLLGRVRLGDTVLGSDPDVDGGFVALLDGDGSVRWSHVFPGITIEDVALAPGDEVVIVGMWHEVATQADAGLGPLTSRGDWDAVVARYHIDGTVRWVETFGGPGDDRSLAVDVGAGRTVVTGYASPGIDLGMGPITWTGFRNVWMLRLDDAGSLVGHALARGGAAGESCGRSVVIDAADGSSYVGGYVSTGIDFGTGPNLDGPSVYVAKWLGNADAFAWVRHYAVSGAGVSSVVDVVLDGGGVVAHGWFRSTLTIGDAYFFASNDEQIFSGDLFLLGLTQAGAVRYARGHGSDWNDVPGVLVATPGGAPVWTGFLPSTEQDVGSGLIGSPGAAALDFAVDVQPDGTLTDLRDVDLSGGRLLLAARPTGGFVVRGRGVIELTDDGTTGP